MLNYISVPLALIGLAISLGLQWKRQQFTSDLLPADVAGMSVYDRGSGSFYLGLANLRLAIEHLPLQV